MESGSSVGEILQKFGETAVNTNERTELIIFRKKILESAFLGMARPAFKLNAKIYIKFSGEIGQDYGGPRREFFSGSGEEVENVEKFTTDDDGRHAMTIAHFEPMAQALFCYTVEPLSKQQFESLCNVSYSEIGSNKRCLEDETIYCWEVFLQDISDGNIPVTFEELLAFITGADKVPPCGFSKAIDISFYPVEHGVYRLPHVSTCSLELHLPRGIDDIKAFQELMIRALKESMGFEKI
ncbi:hypothetical protein FSP39_012519 [Pinctada imbricata]|uniref:HECT-type E3 ubiquitin transferase n=1 Tax=Pinctada imbricata TaxID=66713 RepID=A0AA89BM96_PINIB|nr:hypothetical protein FSP39_012519 [Pinctada imbricata]